MTGWQVVGWVLIADVSIVLTGFAVGFATATVQAFTRTDMDGSVHIFQGRKEQ